MEYNFLAIGIFAVILLASSVRYRGLIAPLAVGLLLRIALVQMALNLALPFDGPDTKNFEAFAYQFGAWGSGSWLELFPGVNSFSFSWLMAGAGLLLGWTKANLLLLSLIPGSLLIRTTYLLAAELGDGKGRAPAAAAWIVALYPVLAILSASMLREAMVQWLLASVCLWLARYVKRGGLANLITVMALLAASVFLHAALILGALPVAWIVAGKMGSRRGARALRSFAVFSVVAVFVLLGSDVALPKIGRLSQVFSLEGAKSALSSRADLLAGSSAYPSWLVPDSFLDLIIRIPALLFYFLFGPLIWSASGLTSQLAAVDGFIYLIGLIVLFQSIRGAGAAPQMRAMLVFNGFLILLFAASVFNQGTAVRHRAKFAAIIGAMAIVSIERKRKQKLLQRRSGRMQPEVPFWNHDFCHSDKIHRTAQLTMIGDVPNG